MQAIPACLPPHHRRNCSPQPAAAATPLSPPQPWPLQPPPPQLSPPQPLLPPQSLPPPQLWLSNRRHPSNPGPTVTASTTTLIPSPPLHPLPPCPLYHLAPPAAPPLLH